uniref:hypothetical protein n=1 Tax=Novosphingobium rosa TaxID=76978 RepID=UPI000AD8C12A
MAGDKLSLIVQFLGVDQLSPAFKSIIGLGKQGKDSVAGLKKEAGDLSRQMRDVQREMRGATGNITTLIDKERQLAGAIGRVNGALQQRARLSQIGARTAAIHQQGQRYVSEGRSELMWAGLAAAPFVAMAKAGGEVEGMTNRLRVLGLGNAAVKDLTAYANAMDVAGSSIKDNLRYIVEAQGAFRESGEHSLAEQLAGAKVMAPIMAKLMTTSKALGHELSEDQERYFLRFIEQAGGMNSPERAAQLSDGLFRAIQSSGGNVNPANYQSFLAKAGTAGMKLTAQSMFADFEPLIAELHESAGVGLTGVYSRANGMVKNQAAMRELVRLGAWDNGKIIYNKVDGIKAFKNGENPLRADLAKQLQESPVDFYVSLRKRYEAAGVKDIQRENMLLFGREGGKLFNLIDKQLPTILKSRAAYQKTEGLEQAYGQTKDSFFGRQGQMTAAWQNFLVVAGTKGGMLDQMTRGLQLATSALKGITAFGNAHPTAFKWIGTAVTSLIGLRVGLSVVKIAFGYLLGPVAELWALWSRYRALGSIAAVFPRIASVFRVVATAGRFLLPVLLAIPLSWVAIGAAIAVAAYVIYRNWDRITGVYNRGVAMVKAAIAPLPNWMKTIGGAMMSGLLMAINPGLLSARLVEIARAGITAFKNFFGIKSPSRLMMQMGGHIATGLADGVDGNSHHARQSMRRMGQGMMGSFTPPPPPRPLQPIRRMGLGVAGALAAASPMAAAARP